MKEEDLLKFLTFIAEEDAQISTIVNFFINTLGYEVTIIENIVNYGIYNNILMMVENGENYKEYKVLSSSDAKNIDWSTSNSLNEIYYVDFDYYREKLFVHHPQAPMGFKQFINNDNI